MIPFINRKPPWCLEATIINDNYKEGEGTCVLYKIYGHNPISITDVFGQYSKNNNGVLGQIYTKKSGINLILNYKSTFQLLISLEDSFNNEGRIKEEILMDCLSCDPNMFEVSDKIMKHIVVIDSNRKKLSLETMDEIIIKRMTTARQTEEYFNKKGVNTGELLEETMRNIRLNRKNSAHQ